MSRRRKLEKFAEILAFDHVYEMSEPGRPEVKLNAFETKDLRGKWREEAFGNDHPICLELACGRGEYAVALARKNPNTNYIGVDIKGARIWQGAKIAKEEGLTNVAFLRIRIEQLALYFAPGEIDEIWITFPDPFPAKENRRMTAPDFLSKYYQLLNNHGQIHLKHDNLDFYDYSVETVEKDKNFKIIYKNEDIYRDELFNPDLSIKTYYEIKHLVDNRTIKYLLFVKNG